MVLGAAAESLHTQHAVQADTGRGNRPAKPPVCRAIALCNVEAGSREASPETLEDPQLDWPLRCERLVIGEPRRSSSTKLVTNQPVGVDRSSETSRPVSGIRRPPIQDQINC